jgi:very-short-patch-repair endonuclease
MSTTDQEEKRLQMLRFQKRLKGKQTTSESLFQQLLDSLGLSYKVEKGFYRNHKSFCFADFYLPKPYRIVIEIDGEYHLTPERKQKDLEKEQYLLERRYHIIRFFSHDVENNIDFVKEKLLNFIEEVKKANTSAWKRKDRPVLLAVEYNRD